MTSPGDPASRQSDSPGPASGRDTNAPLSGDRAVADADTRAAATRDVNIATAPPLPVEPDTANVRLGPEIDEAVLALLPLVGIWRGTGRFGNEPGERAPQFGQQITFAHDGGRSCATSRSCGCWTTRAVSPARVRARQAGCARARTRPDRSRSTSRTPKAGRRHTR